MQGSSESCNSSSAICSCQQLAIFCWSKSWKWVVVPVHLRERILRESHGGVYAGHFSGGKLYSTICRNWWWPTVYRDVMEFCKNCPDCAVVSVMGRKYVPPLHPIPVQRPFQIFGVYIMELPVTERGNRYVIVFQDFFYEVAIVFSCT